MMQRHGWAWLLSAVVLAGCGEQPQRKRTVAPPRESEGKQVASTEKKSEGGETKSTATAGAVAEGWGTIKGKIVWTGDLPKLPPITITKDNAWCEKGGKNMPDETVAVDESTKGVLNIFVYLDKPRAIHDDYPKTAKDVKEQDAKQFEELNKIKWADMAGAIKDGKVKVADLKAPAILNQVYCKYVPHNFAVREGQTLLVLNPEEVAHNVKVASFSGKNDANPNMPANTAITMEWSADKQPMKIECAIHNWMNGQAMCFDHPYFAVTGKDGTFEIKNAPAGEVKLIARGNKYIDVQKGAVGSAKGNMLVVKPGETLDLGEIKVGDWMLAK